MICLLLLSTTSSSSSPSSPSSSSPSSSTSPSSTGGSCDARPPLAPDSALRRARALSPPAPRSKEFAEYEAAEWWEKHADLLSAARAEYGRGPRSAALYAPTIATALEPALAAALAARDTDALRGLARATGAPGVHRLRLLRPAFAAALLGELEHQARSGIPVRRPNGMNRYGVQLRELGFDALLELIREQVVQPLGRLLFPRRVGANDTAECFGFTVQYRSGVGNGKHKYRTGGSDHSLLEHADASVLTLNVNLAPRGGFRGGAVVFRHIRELFTSPPSPALAGRAVEHGDAGVALLHLGQHVHGAETTVGSRTAMILWMSGARGYVRAAPYAEAEAAARPWKTDDADAGATSASCAAGRGVTVSLRLNGGGTEHVVEDARGVNDLLSVLRRRAWFFDRLGRKVGDAELQEHAASRRCSDLLWLYYTERESSNWVWPNDAGWKPLNIQLADRSVTMSMLSKAPRIFHVRNLLSAAEAAEIVSWARKSPRYKNMATMASDGTKAHTAARRGKVAWTGTHFGRPDPDNVMRPSMEAVEQRVAELVRMPLHRSEGLQVVHYAGSANSSDHYYYHVDSHGQAEALGSGAGSPLRPDGRTRFLTVLYYLNTVEEGGETRFPMGGSGDLDAAKRLLRRSFSGTDACDADEGIGVSPSVGDAVLWYNTIPSRDGADPGSGPHVADLLSIHAGCDLPSGEKWAANNWFWNQDTTPAQHRRGAAEAFPAEV